MRYIKIQANKNGSHANQTGGAIYENGWATLPEYIQLPDVFPFVDIVVKKGEVLKIIAQNNPMVEDFENLNDEDYEDFKAKIDFYFEKNHITQEEWEELLFALNNAIERNEIGG